MVPKRKNPTTKEIFYRMVASFMKINEQLEYWYYHLIRIHRIFSKLHDEKLFCTLDIRSSYYNIMVAKDSRKYTTFTIKYKKYKFLWVPFRTHMTPSYFILMINETLKGLDLCYTYLENIIILSKTEKEQPLDHSTHIFDNLWKANIKKKLTKCDFFYVSYSLLWPLTLTGWFISIIQKKINKINQCLHSKNQGAQTAILGLTNTWTLPLYWPDC